MQEEILVIWLSSDGKVELKAVPAELLHNEGEWETKEEGTASESGESGPVVWAQTKTLQGQSESQ